MTQKPILREEVYDTRACEARESKSSNGNVCKGVKGKKFKNSENLKCELNLDFSVSTPRITYTINA